MGNRIRLIIGLLIVLAVLTGCLGEQPEQQMKAGPGKALPIESDAFEAEGTIPRRYTCDGDDLSPPLSWPEPPSGTQSLVLVCDDPDAPVGTWDHWVLFNIPATSRSLPEGVPADPIVDGAGVHGSNSWDRLGYGGPCPPQGGEHRYYFRLYALDATLDLEPGAGKREVEKAMQGHILAQGQLMGLYGR